MISRRSFLITAAALAAMGREQAAATDQIYPAADFVDSIGINTHFSQGITNYVKHYERIIEAIGELKIIHIRDSAVYIDGITCNHYAYTNYRRCAALGYRFSLVCFDPTNPYIRTPASQVPRLFEWCGGTIEIFEGGNEPVIYKNSGELAAISATHQRELYATVQANRSSMPNVVVAAPSYIQQNIQAAEPLERFCDLGNIHPYPGMEHPETTGNGSLLRVIGVAQRISGDKPMIATEIGYHIALQTNSSFLPVPEEARARYMPRLLLWAFLTGVKRSYIYELASSLNNGPTDKESNFGLLDSMMNPTATFEAVRSLMTLCRGSGPVNGVIPRQSPWISFTAPNGLSLALARPDGSILLFAWHGIPAFKRRGDPVSAPVERAATLIAVGRSISVKAHRFRDDGRVDTSALVPKGDTVAINVSDQVTAFEIRYS